MVEEQTTIAVQRYLDDLAGDATAEPVVRELLTRSARRLQSLCGNLLYRDYPRLARPPLSLHQDELLSALVERLMRALQAVRPGSVRQFFALANQHMRWELNDLARRLDAQPRAVELVEGAALAPSATATGDATAALTPGMARILQAIADLPEEEREVFDLVRIQGLPHGEAAVVLGVSTKTVQRRLQRSLLLLADVLGDLGSPRSDPMLEA
jgi:RNA polymerase sigma factor (sigma-70 family)